MLSRQNTRMINSDLCIFSLEFDHDLWVRGLDSDRIFSPLSSQDSDIRYMVLNFWGSQSVLSGCSELENLRLVRWRPSEEWAPWNCVLLTEREAKVHRKIGDNMEEVINIMGFITSIINSVL